MSNQNYIVLKQTKSEGLAIFYVFLFGPLGMFYSTITGAVIMTFVVPIAVFILSIMLIAGASVSDPGSTAYYIFGGSMFITLIFILIGYWLICFIWAYNAVVNYNATILREQKSFTVPQQTIVPKKETNRQELFIQLEQISNLKEKGLLTEAQFEIEKATILEKLGHLTEKQQEEKVESETIHTPKVERPKMTYQENESISGNTKGILILLSAVAIVVIFCFWYYDNNKNAGESTQNEIAIVDSISTVESIDAGEKEIRDGKIISNYFPGTLKSRRYITGADDMVSESTENLRFYKKSIDGEEIYLAKAKTTFLNDTSNHMGNFEMNKEFTYKIENNRVYILKDETMETSSLGGSWKGEICILKAPPAKWQENMVNGLTEFTSEYGKVMSGYVTYDDCVIVTRTCKSEDDATGAKIVHKMYYANKLGLIREETLVNGKLEPDGITKTLEDDWGQD